MSKPTQSFALGLLLVMVMPIASAADDTQALQSTLNSTTAKADEVQAAVNSVHERLLKENRYPSAKLCASCHPRQFRQWSVSQHAYAQLSPVFMSMHNTSYREQSGTLGDFCIRCHTPVGMDLGESITKTNLTRHTTSQEGVTCVVCHRQSRDYGKVSSRGRLQQGNLTHAVYGPKRGRELERVLADSNTFKVVTRLSEKGRKIHRRVKPFFGLTKPKFCGTCHDVTLANGFRLEEALSEYRHSPAALAGHTCQDCHMGKEPGKVSGYERGPAAIVGDVETKPRRLSNHYFAGPDYPIIHPGIFPFNPDAEELATLKQWLKFDVAAGWGTDKFEDNVSDKQHFPKPWDSADARFDAREIINDQRELLAWAKGQRQKVLRAGYQIKHVCVHQVGPKGIRFDVEVKNATSGHNAPTGFIAERLVFLEVTVRDNKGRVVYRSGDRDPNGDVRDLHSRYVHVGLAPLDDDLFNLQSKFMIRNDRGSEREAVLPINRSPDPRPFVRPSPFSAILTGNPQGARIHRKAIPPETSRLAHYHIPASDLRGHRGPYRLTVRLIAQMVPVNLVARIEKVGFDYGLSAHTVARRVVKGAHVVQVVRRTLRPGVGHE